MLPCDSFDLSSIDAAVYSVFRRDDTVEVAVVFVPLSLALPLFPVRRDGQHSKVLPVERVAFVAHGEIRQLEVVRVVLGGELLLVLETYSETREGGGHDD